MIEIDVLFRPLQARFGKATMIKIVLLRPVVTEAQEALDRVVRVSGNMP